MKKAGDLPGFHWCLRDTSWLWLNLRQKNRANRSGRLKQPSVERCREGLFPEAAALHQGPHGPASHGCPSVPSPAHRAHWQSRRSSRRRHGDREQAHQGEVIGVDVRSDVPCTHYGPLPIKTERPMASRLPSASTDQWWGALVSGDGC